TEMTLPARHRPSSPELRAVVAERLPLVTATGTAPALWAELIPDVTAVVAGERSVTFDELNARINQLVHALRARGLKVGDSVALMCSNRIEFAEVFWATRRAGWRVTTINWHLTGDEAAYIVNDCDAKAFIADTRFAAAAAHVAEHAPSVDVRLSIGGDISRFESYDAFVANESPENIPDPNLGTSMLYPSGTTGRPKGVLRTGLAGSPLGIVDEYVPGESVHLCTGPLYHAAPLSFSLGVPHLNGATVVMMDGWD